MKKTDIIKFTKSLFELNISCIDKMLQYKNKTILLLFNMNNCFGSISSLMFGNESFKTIEFLSSNKFIAYCIETDIECIKYFEILRDSLGINIVIKTGPKKIITKVSKLVFSKKGKAKNITIEKLNSILEGILNMPKFDLIVGNPPYTRGGKDTRPLYIEILHKVMKNAPDTKVIWICPTQWVYGYNIKGSIINNFKNEYKINDYVHITNPFEGAVMANLVGIYFFDYTNKHTINYEDIFYTQFSKPELVKSIEQKFKNFNGHLCDYNNIENTYKYYVNAALIRGNIDQVTGKKKWDWTTLFGEDQRTIFDKRLKDRNVFWKFKTLKECKNFVAAHETDILEFAQFIEKSNSNICLGLTPYLVDYTKQWTEKEIAKKLKLTKEEVDYIHQEMKNFGWKVAPRQKTKVTTNKVFSNQKIKALQVKGLTLMKQMKKKAKIMFNRAYSVEWRKINKKFSNNKNLRSYHYAKTRLALAKKFV